MKWSAILLAQLIISTVPTLSGAQQGLADLRSLYYDAVNRESAIAPALAAIDEIRERASGPGEAALRVDEEVLLAYEGAIVTLRAKHGFWPPARLRHMREGLELMDRAVADNPDHPEIRYLRLMSCFYLPGILGRKWSVEDDFEALARLLPNAESDYPADLYEAIVTFVLENGDLDPHTRASLQHALKR